MDHVIATSATMLDSPVLHLHGKKKKPNVDLTNP